jgi:hypothetical protein
MLATLIGVGIPLDGPAEPSGERRDQLLATDAAPQELTHPDTTER